MSSTTDTVDSVAAARAAFARGEPVLIHDAADREGEVDIVYPAKAVDADAVRRLRNDAGGLICVAITDAVAEAWGLPTRSTTPPPRPAIWTTTTARRSRCR
jgi:3,4-dihydroxy 2-butanone 4-phosphate synthase